jgi:ribonuclease HI
MNQGETKPKAVVVDMITPLVMSNADRMKPATNNKPTTTTSMPKHATTAQSITLDEAEHRTTVTPSLVVQTSVSSLQIKPAVEETRPPLRPDVPPSSTTKPMIKQSCGNLTSILGDFKSTASRDHLDATPMPVSTPTTLQQPTVHEFDSPSHLVPTMLEPKAKSPLLHKPKVKDVKKRLESLLIPPTEPQRDVFFDSTTTGKVEHPTMSHPDTNKELCGLPRDWFTQESDEALLVANTSARTGILKRSITDQMGLLWTPPPKHTPYHGETLKNTHDSPVNVDYIRDGLCNHPNKDFVDFVVDNAVNGARLGFTCPVEEVAPTQRQAKNLSSSKLHPHIIDKFVEEEVKEKRWAGPFDKPPHPLAQTIPLGLAKKGDYPMHEKARIITHCSKKWQDGPSMNDLIPDEAAAITYTKWVNLLDDVRMLEEREGEDGCVWGCTTDLKNAFRVIKIHDEHLHLLCYAWIDKNGVEKFYVEQTLSFGARANPRTFDALSSAIHYILDLRMKQAGIDVCIHHYLDDIIILGTNKASITVAFQILEEVLGAAGLPLQPTKTCPPTQRLTFLGGVFDFEKRTIEMPEVKRKILVGDLESIYKQPNKKVLVSKLHSVVGKLGWQGAVMAALRPKIKSFFDVLYPALIAIEREPSNSFLKTVATTPELRMDAETFATALRKNPKAHFDSFHPNILLADAIFTTDASGRDGIGGWGYVPQDEIQMKAFFMPWESGWTQDDDKCSSTAQELVAILAVVRKFGPRCPRIMIWTDSDCAVRALAKGWSKSQPVHLIVTEILKVCAVRGCCLRVLWHNRSDTVSAVVADLLSHGLINDAQELLPVLRNIKLERVKQASITTTLKPPQDMRTST